MKNTTIPKLSILCICLFFSLQIFAQIETNGITVRLNHKLLDFEKIDDEKLLTGKIGDFLNTEGLAYLNNSKFQALNSLSFTKIFTTLKTSDSISISRSGDEVSIPPFWATFNVRTLPNSNFNYHKLVGTLNSLYPLIIYAHPNYSCELLSVPNDSLYSLQQSLSSDTFALGHINVDSAWNIETGKRYIKVGVFDSGIDTTHPDLKILTGRGYNYNPDTDSTSWGTDQQGFHGHGTLVAGIIGAKRNNGIGVAGIAGGDGSDTSGVSLIDFRLSPTFNGENISKAIIDASRSVGTYYDWSTSQPPIVNEEDYWYHANGYGIHLGNHSYKIKVANVLQIDSLPEKTGEDSTLTTDPGSDAPPIECKLCREAFLFSLKNGVVNVCASGNGVLPVDHPSDYYTEGNAYPQNYDDSWLINVGGTGRDGEWFDGTNGDVNEIYFFAMANSRMDVAAPFTQALNYSTASIQASDTISRYSGFAGTSASAPHVTGIAALLLSKYNQNCYTNSNLDPADVEYILEHSACDVSGVGYDDYTGYGLVNAHRALKMIYFPEYQIVHPDLTPITITTTAIDTITVFLNNPLYNESMGPISSDYPLQNERYYRVIRKEIQTEYDFSSYLQPSTQILDAWPCPSRTNSSVFLSDTFTVADPDLGMVTLSDTFKLEPNSEIVIFNAIGNVTLKGYYYHFIERYLSEDDFYGSTTSVNYWYPINPAVQNPRMAFSVYLRDSLAPLYSFSCDSLNPLIDSLASIQELNESDIVLYPNPGNGMIKIISNHSELKSVQVIGVNGICIKTENVSFSSESGAYEFNFSELANGLYNMVLCTQDGKRINKKWLKL